MTLDDKIESLINRCAFDNIDRDIGTTGLCGTFALALYNTLHKRGVPAQLVLLCPAKDGKPIRSESGRYHWSHVMIKVGSSYFDVDGKVELAHALDKYVWGHLGNGSMDIPISYSELVKELRIERSHAFDGPRLADWKKAFKNNYVAEMRSLISILETESPSFVQHLFDAVNAAEVGFWFEEGGCWGMAMALYERFKSLGYPAELVVEFLEGRPSHAMIRSGGKYYDYNGEVSVGGDIRPVSLRELKKLAQECGHGDDILDTKADALEIITNAEEMI